VSAEPTVECFAHQWTHAVAARPDQVFLRYEGADGHVAEWTYGSFDLVVSRVAARLHDAGVSPGSAVHLVLRNSPTFVAAMLAASRLGGWIIPSDPFAQATELAGHIRRTKPVVGLCAAERATVYRQAGPTTPMIEIDEDDVALTRFGEVEYADWSPVQPTDRAAVMFTSGTTGVPKGVEITQANYAFAGSVMAEAAGLEPDHRQLVVLPLFHANAQYYSLASAIAVGASVALIHTFSAGGFLGQAVRHQATHASLFAAPLRMILARTEAPVEGLRLEHCWYAQNITDQQYEDVSSLLGCRPRQLYGMTETIPAVLTEPHDDPVPSSMGRVSRRCVVDVHDADGMSVPDGEVGELVVGGTPGITLFAGYLDDAATTAASFRDGWFRTGDRASRDHDGRHYFDGRRSDVLKVAGENVSIVEVETVLADHPDVLEAAVVGKPDPVRDEVPVGYVVPASSAVDVDALHVWCAERLSKAKRPREITVIDELPRTSVGKIRKFLLSDPNAEAR